MGKKESSESSNFIHIGIDSDDTGSAGHQNDSEFERNFDEEQINKTKRTVTEQHIETNPDQFDYIGKTKRSNHNDFQQNSDFRQKYAKRMGETPDKSYVS